MAEDTALDPFDVATMLAMAQMQADAIPGAAFYKVFLLLVWPSVTLMLIGLPLGLPSSPLGRGYRAPGSLG